MPRVDIMLASYEAVVQDLPALQVQYASGQPAAFPLAIYFPRSPHPFPPLFPPLSSLQALPWDALVMDLRTRPRGSHARVLAALEGLRCRHRTLVLSSGPSSEGEGAAEEVRALLAFVRPGETLLPSEPLPSLLAKLQPSMCRWGLGCVAARGWGVGGKGCGHLWESSWCWGGCHFWVACAGWKQPRCIPSPDLSPCPPLPLWLNSLPYLPAPTGEWSQTLRAQWTQGASC